MRKKPVIIKIPFNGDFETFIDENGRFAYSDATSLKEYNRFHPGKFRLISWYEYHVLRNEHFSKKLEKISPQEFEKAKTKASNIHVIKSHYQFFFGAQIAGPISELYVWDKARHKAYKGATNIALHAMEIYALIIKDILK